VIGKRGKGISRRMDIFSVSMKEIQNVRIQVDVLLLFAEDTVSEGSEKQ